MLGSTTSGPTGALARRDLSWFGLIALLVAFTLVPAILDVFVLHREGDDAFPDQGSATGFALSKGIGLVIVLLAISALRWWPAVLREELRTRRWVWVVPISLLVASVATVDYGRLATAGVVLGLTLLVGTLFIGAGEELLFRGVTLTFLRGRHSEWIAALGSSLLFGAFHVLGGPVHMVTSALFGYLLYYVRRVSSGIWVPILVHAAWDFAVFSGVTTAVPETDPDTGFILTALSVVLLIVLLVGRRAAEPHTPVAA